MRVHRVAALALAAVLGASLSGCVVLGGGPAEQTPQPATPSPTEPAESDPATTTPEPSPTAEAVGAECEVGDYDCAMRERDQFLEDQQLPLDGSPLEAVTPEQREFIAAQREHVESQGMTWTPQNESLVLALTSDACESAILNFHQVDAALLRTHMATSPIFQQIAPDGMSESERLQAQSGAADIMVFGTQYICPDDFPGWASAFTEVFPDY